MHFIIKGSPLKINDKMWTPDRSDASFTGRVGSKPKPIFFSVNKNASELLLCGQGSLAAPITCSNSASHPQKFDELLQLAFKGQHTNVDMLVKDVYGGACQTLGLSGNLIASSFGKSTTADKGISIEKSTGDLLYKEYVILPVRLDLLLVQTSSGHLKGWKNSCLFHQQKYTLPYPFPNVMYVG